MQKHLKSFTFIAVSISSLMLLNCFPSDSNSDNPTDQQDPGLIFDGSDPGDLPTEINQSANTSEAGIDSMFRLLTTRVESMEGIEAPSDLYAIDFASLRKGFGSAINKNPNHVKANIGFIVSSVLSLNESKNLQNMIDSLGDYISNMDEYYTPEDSYLMKNKQNSILNKRLNKTANVQKPLGFLSKTYANHGLLMTGQALVAQTPQILLAQTKRPSFPRFLTMSFIQNTIESSIIPRLNEIISSTQRLRNISNMSLSVSVDGETAEIDNSDIYLLEAAVRAARAGFTMMCIYDMDLYSPDGSPDMRWIDKLTSTLDTADGYSAHIYKFRNDTLFETYYSDDTPVTSDICDVIQYNLNRSSFLSIRRNFHINVYNDLKMVPDLIKSGITSIKNETDNQDNDLLPATDIMDISSEMAEFSADMIDEGFTSGLASHFRSPESLMDFISQLLSEPYTFDETIDGISVKLKIDLSKFFTNPAQRLTDYWPKYLIANGNERFKTYSYSYSGSYTTSDIYLDDSYYDTIIVDIPDDIITQSSTNSDYIELDQNYPVVETDSTRICFPVNYVDDNGKSINMIDLMYDDITGASLQKFFPYFNDYTFGGVFPDMSTRQKWIDFFVNFIDE